MSAPKPSYDGLISWFLELAGQAASSSLVIALAVVFAVLSFAVAWVIKPIVGEYSKLWHFHRIPPWRVRRNALAEIQQRERAVAAQQAEIDASTSATCAALDRAEQIEVLYLARTIECNEQRQELIDLRAKLALLAPTMDTAG